MRIGPLIRKLVFWGAHNILRAHSQKGGQILILQKNDQNKSFLSHQDEENEPNIMRIGPLIRKLVFWGAHSIFGGLKGIWGPISKNVVNTHS